MEMLVILICSASSIHCLGRRPPLPLALDPCLTIFPICHFRGFQGLLVHDTHVPFTPLPFPSSKSSHVIAVNCSGIGFSSLRRVTNKAEELYAMISLSASAASQRKAMQPIARVLCKRQGYGSDIGPQKDECCPQLKPRVCR